MDVHLQDLRGRPTCACYQLYGDFLFSLSFRLPDCTWGRQPTNPMMTAAAAAAAFLLKPKTDLFKYYYHTLITLSHSLRFRPLLLQTPTTRSSFFPARREISTFKEGNFFPQHCWQHCSISNLPPEGRKSRDRGSGGGNFILVQIFTSPWIHLTVYYLRHVKRGNISDARLRIYIPTVISQCEVTIYHHSCKQ